ncbi:helix-turn-helix domain-containing protein [Gluconobacter sphaericus]|nr:helix-turn-helix domain-containing protein [Gluconobacter sphaericus]MBF0886052.1 helix-turn-helix domain-containing protein [Gluconobacter sphaericus]MBS1086190.1 helix-turn-helix domain-containing protein [Gluconobacter sphaericus]MBS1100143.1 helix-turn-helix domain-containing protein [Gluconobacter sphaericus]
MRNESKNAVRKAACILKALSLSGIDGEELGQLAALCELPKATTHRLLASLMQEHLVTRVPQTRRYILAPTGHFQLNESQFRLMHSRRLRSVIAGLPLQENDAVFLLARSNNSAICIDAYFGNEIIPSLTQGVGGRIPLGFGPGATMILAGCEDETINDVLQKKRPKRQYEILIENIARAKASGYTTDQGAFINGVGGVAVSIPERNIGTGLVLGVALSIKDHPVGIYDTLGKILLDAVSTTQPKAAAS